MPVIFPPRALAGGGWAVYLNSTGTEAHTTVWETAVDLSMTELTLARVQNYGSQHILGRFRLSVTADDRSLFADGPATGGDVTAT
jgi:hypothetical protein